MGSKTDKASGALDKMIGKGKQAVGNATNNDDLAAEGAVQEGKGHIKTGMGEVKGASKARCN